MDTYRHTPGLTVIDSRGLVVRKVGYLRTPDNEETREDVSAITFDLAGRITELWDARLWAQAQNEPSTQPNRTHLYSLSGIPLLSVSVDEGWDLTLMHACGVVDRSWESKGACWDTDYDDLLRPTAKHEKGPDQKVRMMSRCVYAQSSAASAAHNQCGQMIEIYDDAGVVKFPEFGILGQGLAESRQFLEKPQLPDWSQSPPPAMGAEKLTHLTHNALDELLTQTDASGNRQRLMHDIAGAVQQVYLTLKDEAEIPLLTNVSYNALGQVERETAGNGVLSTSVYDAMTERLSKITTQKDQAFSQKLEYRYDPVGNVTEITDSAQVVRYFRNQEILPTNCYRYDSLYQLVEASGRESATVTGNYPPPEYATPDPGDTQQFLNYSETYRYDQAGNMLALRHIREGNNYTRTFAVSEASNRSVQITDEQPDPDVNTAFDVAGNLLSLQPGRALQWGLRNQLSKIATVTRADSNHDEEVYVYDGSDQRVRKLRTFQTQSTTRQEEVFYLPGLEIRITGTDAKSSEHLEVITVQAGRSSIRCLHWVSGKPDDIPNKQIRYGLNDHLNSCSMELGANAELLNHEGYLPFGGTAWWAARNDLGGKYKTIRYSGKERDASGLYYYGYRYYAPWLQRWINPDPLGDIDGLNLYRMTDNNPISFLDVDGGISTEAKLAWGGLTETQNQIVQVASYTAFNRMSLRKDQRSRPSQTVLSNLRRNLRKAITSDVAFHLAVVEEIDIRLRIANTQHANQFSTRDRNIRGAITLALTSSTTLGAMAAGASIGSVVAPGLGTLAGLVIAPTVAYGLKSNLVDPVLKKHNVGQPIHLKTTELKARRLWDEVRSRSSFRATLQHEISAYDPLTYGGQSKLSKYVASKLAGQVTSPLGWVGQVVGDFVEVGHDVMSSHAGKMPFKESQLHDELNIHIEMLVENLGGLKDPMEAAATGIHPGIDIKTSFQMSRSWSFDQLMARTRHTIVNIVNFREKLTS